MGRFISLDTRTPISYCKKCNKPIQWYVNSSMIFVKCTECNTDNSRMDLNSSKFDDNYWKGKLRVLKINKLRKHEN